MDYELDGVRNTVVLGGSIGDKFVAMDFLEVMSDQYNVMIWCVDEEDLPWGYKFQTYYVAAYDPDQRMIGTH
jgi:predicted transcriptional regulator